MPLDLLSQQAYIFEDAEAFIQRYNFRAALGPRCGRKQRASRHLSSAPIHIRPLRPSLPPVPPTAVSPPSSSRLLSHAFSLPRLAPLPTRVRSGRSAPSPTPSPLSPHAQRENYFRDHDLTPPNINDTSYSCPKPDPHRRHKKCVLALQWYKNGVNHGRYYIVHDNGLALFDRFEVGEEPADPARRLRIPGPPLLPAPLEAQQQVAPSLADAPPFLFTFPVPMAPAAGPYHFDPPLLDLPPRKARTRLAAWVELLDHHLRHVPLVPRELCVPLVPRVLHAVRTRPLLAPHTDADAIDTGVDTPITTTNTFSNEFSLSTEPEWIVEGWIYQK
ncbi:hypothetical protein GGX14DRAFT_637673 [Mycena pura]|uniref:Uncharacterized protein n=1 Tax=Mycena pura TaxID=153505 RepID=A0AAD6VAB8_9AGAR|nr:hypothetical protein GGX14DRAFT_637673 [Mycena pura]